jgi:predicted glycosyltransferase
MNLLWYSDLVVSGGGTMNREAAALGVPVYSIFRGTIGAVDRYLEAEGRLTLVTSVEDVDKKILLVPRVKGTTVDTMPRKALSDIVNHLEDIINSECD